MFDPFNEYPHSIQVGRMKIVGKYPNQREQFVSDKTIQGFMDTPTTSEMLKYHQMDKTFDRNLYTPYDVGIDVSDILVYEGNRYQVVGHPVDQGGQHEVNLTRLQVVPSGKG